MIAIQLTQNNYGHKININIKNPDGTVTKLDGDTVEMHVILPNRIKKIYQLNIIDSVNGKVQFTIPAEMTAIIGTCCGYTYVINPLSKITLSEIVVFKISEEDGGIV